MTTSPENFLEDAVEMLTYDTESWYRHCCSRAYYAAFLGTRYLTENLPNPDSSRFKGTHETHAWKLITSSDKRLKRIGHILNQERALRNQADYDLHIPISYFDARGSIRDTKEIFESLKT